MDFRFYFSDWSYRFRAVVQREPLLCAVFALALLILLGTFAWMSAAQARRNTAQAELGRLQSTLERKPAPAMLRSAHPNLPAPTPVHLVAALHESAGIAGLDLQDVAFSWENSASQPYIRYRAAFSLTTTYAGARKFIAAMLAQGSNIMLDELSCARKEERNRALSCDFTFSELYGPE